MFRCGVLLLTRLGANRRFDHRYNHKFSLGVFSVSLCEIDAYPKRFWHPLLVTTFKSIFSSYSASPALWSLITFIGCGWRGVDFRELSYSY